MLYAGLDAAGTPDLTGTDSKHDPYVVVIAAVPDKEALRLNFLELRSRLGMKASDEFHAHSMTEETCVAVIDTAITTRAIIGALLIDKAATRQIRDPLDLPNPSDFYMLTSLVVFEVVVKRYELVDLYFDEDIKGKQRQQAFITEMKRINRTLRPDTPVRVRPQSSDKSDLIQLADVVAYVLGRWAKKLIRTDGLKQCIAYLLTQPENIIMGPKPWD